MVETAIKSDIVFREIVDETTINKVDTRPLEKALESIELASYGTGIKEILFIVVALPPGSAIHKDEVVYDRRKRKLTLELNLDYYLVLSSNKNEVLKMVATLFIESLTQYPRLKINCFEIDSYVRMTMLILNKF